MSEDYTMKFYGAASSIEKDLAEHYRRTETNLESLHIWSTRLCEVIVVILDYEFLHRPMVGAILRMWQRFVEEGSNLYYWKEVDLDVAYDRNSSDLMKYFDDEKGKWIRRTTAL